MISQNHMPKNIIISIVISLVILTVVGLGFYLYQKTKISESEVSVAVDSTGGTLTVTEMPIVKEEVKPSVVETKEKNMNKITIETNLGKIVLELYPKDAPKAVENFTMLAQKGFYSNLIFHRVIPGFMIQGGDPLGTGSGGPGYQFADELDPNTPSAKAGYKKGVLAMANAGPNTNGSQFFIMLEDYPLPHNYTIFGRVVSGQDVVDAIGKTKTGPNDRPITPVTMKLVTVGE